MLTIWTDGSCLANPDGPGGWAFKLEDEPVVAGGLPATTNNRAELLAVIHALKAVPPGSAVEVRSDSKLTVECGSRRWKRRSNLDLWVRYDALAAERHVSLTWVRRSSCPENEEVDRAANAEAYQIVRGLLRDPACSEVAHA